MSRTFHTQFTPLYINTTRRNAPAPWTLDALSAQLHMHLTASQILTTQLDIPFWCHPNNTSKTVALDKTFVDGLLMKIAFRWARAGVKDMEQLHTLEITRLRAVVDRAVAAKVGWEAMRAKGRTGNRLVVTVGDD